MIKTIKYFLIFAMFGLMINPAFAQFNTDSLLNLEKSAKGALKANIQNKLALSFRKSKDYSKSADWAQQAIESAKAAGDKKEELSALMHAGYAFYFQNSFDKAADFFEKALKKYEEAGLKDGGYTKLLENLASIYRQGKQADKAIMILERILKNAENAGDKNAIANTQEGLGILYDQKKNYGKAIEYYKKAQSMFEGLNNQEGVANELNFIGISYYYFGNHDESINYLNKALALAKSKNMKITKEISSNIETINKAKEGKSNAVTQFEKESKEKEGQKLKEMENLSTNLLHEKVKTQEELELLANENKLKDSKLNQTEEIMEKQKNIFRKDSAKSQAQISTLTQEKKKTEMELFEEQENLKRQRILIVFIIAIAVIILIFSFVLWKQFRLKKKAYDQLFIQNEEIKRQKTQIEDQAIELAKLSIVASKTDNAVMIMDPLGTFEWINESFKRIFGLSIDDLHKQNCSTIVQFSRHTEIEKILKNCLTEKKTVVYETDTKTGFGYKIWTQTSLTPILNENNEVIKLVAIDSDITLIKKAEEEIRAKNHELEEKNELITDSIHYAKTIQEAILPTAKIINSFFSDIFIYYKPRDIVSGDFYWIGELNSKIYLAVVDCTGHGVPGGFMSMIGHALLNEIILEKKIATPSDILNELNSQVITVFHKDSNIITHQEDGMDITICCIDKAKNEIQFSLANHSVHIFNGSEEKTIEGDLYSIGEILTQRFAHKYSNHIYTYTPGTTLFMYSDGYKDQFGGPENRKFSSDRLYKIFAENKNLKMDAIPEILEKTINDWKKEESQIDDILIVGMRL